MLYYIWFIFSVLLTLAYAFLVYRTHYFWSLAPSFRLPKNYQPTTSISVVIAARNEAHNIVHCLNALANQHFPSHLLEIIVVDDFSEDETADLVRSFSEKHLPNVRLLQMAHTPLPKEASSKKKAISLALAHAKGRLIVCTDADCLPPTGWLLLIEAFHVTKKAVFIAAPVFFKAERGFFERFQNLDMIGMMGATAAGIYGKFSYLCNGANMAYTREAFDAVGGYAHNDDKASGDDMFLLHKVAAQWQDHVHFLKSEEAAVLTHAQPTLAKFVNQRLRWGTKNASYQTARETIVLAAIFFFSWSVIIQCVLGVFNSIFFYIFIFQILIKIIFDYRILSSTTKFFQRRELMRDFLPAVFVHVVYIALVGLLANLVKTYEWKGRSLR